MYIEINLLPPEFRPKKALIKLDVKFIGIVLIIFASAGLGGYYFYLQRSVRGLTGQIEFMRGEERKLKEIVSLNVEVENLKKDISERMEVIKGLTSESDIRFAVLEYINYVIPENLWISSINESNQSGKITFDIEGMTFAKEDISKFLAGLEKFEKFGNVSLETIDPAPLEVRDAYRYIVKVELASTQPSVASKGK